MAGKPIQLSDVYKLIDERVLPEIRSMREEQQKISERVVAIRIDLDAHKANDQDEALRTELTNTRIYIARAAGVAVVIGAVLSFAAPYLLRGVL